jgi:hypothetical protein
VSGNATLTVTGSTFRVQTPFPNTVNANGPTPTVYVAPIYIPSDVTQFTLHMANTWNQGATGDSALTGVNIAIYRSDGTGLPTGSPLSEWDNQTIPSDGTDWIAPGPTTATRGTDGKVVLVHSAPATTSVAYTLSCNHGTYTANTSTVNPVPSPTGGDPNPICLMHYEFVTSRRRIVVLGDSISIGCVS